MSERNDMLDLDLSDLGEAVTAAMQGRYPAVGDTVIAWNAEKPITYGGPDEHGSSFVLVIGIGTNSMTVKCPADRVAPADTPLADAKDWRITVEKRKGPSWLGNWVLTVRGLPGVTSYHKLKRDAVAEGQRRLAILNWQLRDRYVTRAGWGHGNNATHDRVDVPEGMVGVYAKVGGLESGAEGWFLVPLDEYRETWEHGFVVDEGRHEPWPAPEGGAHRLLVEQDDKYGHLYYPRCSLGDWSMSAAVGLDAADHFFKQHLPTD